MKKPIYFKVLALLVFYGFSLMKLTGLMMLILYIFLRIIRIISYSYIYKSKKNVSNQIAFHPQKMYQKLKVFWGFWNKPMVFVCSKPPQRFIPPKRELSSRRRIGVWSLQGSGSKSWNATHKKQAQRRGHRWGPLGWKVQGESAGSRGPKNVRTSRWVVFSNIFWNVHPYTLGEDEAIFDEHIFQMGWFNHQLVILLRIIFQASWQFRCKLAVEQLQGACTWRIIPGSVVNYHGDRFRPLRIELWDPFQMRKNEHQATDAFATSDCILGGG